MFKNSLSKLFTTNASTGAFILRLGLGIIFTAHGGQKLFGWFGGYGLQGTAQFMSSLGLEPGTLMAILAGGAEFFGGLALLVGILVRPAALALAFTMIVAAITVHLKNGFFLSNNGFEYAFALLMACFALLFLGGGSFSVDRQLAQKV